jgi:uncharacterized damage-inducible protein DinB
MHRTIAYNLALLRQTDQLLEQLNDEALAGPRELLFGSSIGGHLRHVLEYYQCLLHQAPHGSVCYDRRQRDPLMERHVHHARSAVEACIAALDLIRTDQPLTLTTELPDGLGVAENSTSLLRELTYVADHCVHHLAMVRIVLQQQLPQVQYSAALGVAAATRNHHAS